MPLLQTPRTRRALALLALTAATAGACLDAPPGPSPLPGAQIVRVSWCRGLAPTWVAFQDGDGPWTRATPVRTGDTITFEHGFAAPRGAIATLTPIPGNMTALLVLYGEPAELASAGDTKAILCDTAAPRTVRGTVVGLDTNEAAIVSAQVSSTVAGPLDGFGFSLSELGPSPHDLIAARETRAGGRTAVTGIIVRRDVVVAAGDSVPPLDFASPEAFAPATATVTLGNFGPAGAQVAVRLLTATTEALIAASPGASPEAIRPYMALPVDRLRPGDLQELLASTADGSAGRTIEAYFRAPLDRALTLPAPLLRPTIDTIATTPILSLRARFTPQPDYDRITSITYQQGGTVLVSVAMTTAYAARTANRYDLALPDLSAVAGFDPAWALHPGEVIRWTAARVGGTVGLGVDPHPGDGDARRTALDSDLLEAVSRAAGPAARTAPR